MVCDELAPFTPGLAAAFLDADLTGIGFFFGMAFFSQLVGHSSTNWALKWLSTSTVAISLLGEPIGASVLAYLFFDERLTIPKVIGGGLILMAIYLAARQEGQPA